MWTPWGGSVCHDEAYYTDNAFSSPPKMLVEFLMHCSWAKATKDVNVKAEHLKRIYCIAWEDSLTSPTAKRSHIYQDPSHLLSQSAQSQKRAAVAGPTRLFYSDDFYKTRHMVEFDLGRDAKHFVGFGPSKKFLVTALRDISSSSKGGLGTEMALFVSLDGDHWERARFPHGAGLTEGAYTIVEGTTHSLVVDVVDTTLGGQTGTLFTSDSKGVNFVKSLEGTNRNSRGFVDYEHLANIEGVSIVNVRADIHLGNSQHGTGSKSLITFNDGSSWNFLQPPSGECSNKKLEECSLHLYSVTKLHNVGRVFSSTAPGFVMGVGSVGNALLPYESCDTFISTDAGRTWRLAVKDAHKYEFGDQGSVLLLVNDEQITDKVLYSWDHGKKWEELSLGIKMRAKLLTTIPDGTSQKFLLVGKQSRSDAVHPSDTVVAIFIDFAGTMRKCSTKDMEKWEASGDDGKGGKQCLMGHTQYFERRKEDAKCYVGEKFHDPVSKKDPCPCTEADFECDFGFVRDEKNECTPSGPIKIPQGECTDSKTHFKASNGYRKVPGNECRNGVPREGLKDYPCNRKSPKEGEVYHQSHPFSSPIIEHIYFSESTNIIVKLQDGHVWRSVSDGVSWSEVGVPDDKAYPNAIFLAMAPHNYDKERGFLLTSGQRFLVSTDRGKNWHHVRSAPTPPNSLGIPVLLFHPKYSDWIIWTGYWGNCSSYTSSDCRAVAFYSRDNGNNWHKIDEYVRTCNWAAASAKFKTPDPEGIICESYRDKKGSQRSFDNTNPLQLILGTNFYRQKQRLFDSIEGFAVFDEFLVVADYHGTSDTLTLMISLDAIHFAPAQFPPNTKVEKRAYTVLDSNTGSIFLHGTTHSSAGTEWGALFRSNGNGTYFTRALEHVNRNTRGYVDFEKMLGLEGIALANVVSNPEEAMISGVKQIQTRITHNDAARWKTLNPPAKDVFGEEYKCRETYCSLQLHGYTERDDPRNVYSSPSAVGVMLAVGNVGEHLAPYKDSDTFLTRDGGFTWEEVHKDAHKWEFGDQGSLIVLVNDEEPTSIVSYSTDEGLSWHDYNFGETLRVSKILTVPEDTHRKFLLIGARPTAREQAVVVHLDFSSVTTRRCNPKTDFEQWKPRDAANEQCLFGREVSYNRRIRDANCYVGEKIVQPYATIRNCTCQAEDFECEFNYHPDPNDPTRCILYHGVLPLPSNEEEQCLHGEDGPSDYWYERTSVRKVPHSSCQGGSRPDRGARHICKTSTRRHGWFWWLSIVAAPFGLAGLVAVWWNKQQSQRSQGYGRIRLPGGSMSALDYAGDSKVLQTLASVPWFIVGTAGLAWSSVLSFAERVPVLRNFVRHSGHGTATYGGYRTLRPQDDDAEILREYDDDELS